MLEKSLVTVRFLAGHLAWDHSEGRVVLLHAAMYRIFHDKGLPYLLGIFVSTAFLLKFYDLRVILEFECLC